MLMLGVVAILAANTMASDPPRLEFTRMVAHWDSYGTPEYLKFIEDARPEIVQVGFYGGHFWSLGHTAQYKEYPAHFPVRGISELGDWFEDLNGKLHARGAKVVGHFNVEFLVGDPDGPDGPRGFFKFYRDLWDEKLLGPRPVVDPLSMMEKDAEGRPIKSRTYAIGGMDEYWGCLRNPAWQAVLKAWVKQGVRRGLDGFMINYFYRHNCLCEHCQAGCRAYMKGRFTPEELQTNFQIADLASHRFTEIVSWHPATESTPLRREMLRFSQISNKQVFDEVFVKYGRSLKPDLIVAQWNHLGDFSQIDGDERCLLPADLWGKDESYLWYSTGGSAAFTDLKRNILGEGTLQARYIRGAFDDRPFTLGKYEGTRTRVAIAELAANGGSPMGFYTRFTDPQDRAEIVRYYAFLRENDAVYRCNRPRSEFALLFPRKDVHAGKVESIAAFRTLGRALLDAHVLFDIFPDDHFSDDLAAKYRGVIRVSDPPDSIPKKLSADRSQFRAPATVRVSASTPSNTMDELDLHFVNYNRNELPHGADGQPQAGSGVKDDQPIAVPDVTVDLAVPEGATLRSVVFLTPERPEAKALDAKIEGGRLRFAVPEFLVYGVVRIQFHPRP